MEKKDQAVAEPRRASSTAWLGLLVLLALFLLGVGVRKHVLDTQYRALKSVGLELPFTLEGALQYRMVRIVHDEGTLPEREDKVQWPEGIELRKTYSIGSEFVYARLAKLLPKSWPLEHRVRLWSLWIFCLTIPLLAVWAALVFESRIAGLVTGLYYAVATSSVIRSTGQELSRENFALPFLAGFLALDALAARREGRAFWISAVAAAGCLALAICNWDLIQYFIYLWLLTRTVSFARRGTVERPERIRFYLVVVALFLAALINPYLRAHNFAGSPALLWALGLGLVLAWQERGKVVHPGLRWCLPFVPLVLVMLVGRGYAENYNHFGGLVWAKLANGNVKPADPGLLNYDQRIMWTPALHSATWRMAWDLFKLSLFFGFTSCVFLLCLGKRCFNRRFVDLVFYFLVSAFSYALFVRFHVYLAVFMAGCIGGAAALMTRLSFGKGVAAMALVALGLGLELKNVIQDPLRWGRPNIFYKHDAELIDWLKEHAEGAPVVANFRISGSILPYADCPVIMHPKFENREIRDRVRAYGEHLFLKSEKEFRDWTTKYKARYYVYSRGQFAKQQPEYQMRYMVDALKPPREAAARQFRDAPRDTTWFEFLYQNKKYNVYRIINDEDIEFSNDFADMAERALQNGDLKMAEKRAQDAMRYWPKNPRGMKTFLKVRNLIFQGVEGRPR